MENKSKRLAYIDTAKFLAIFAVAFAHISETGIAIPLLYSFHLPLFFFLSGATLHIDKDRKFGDYLVKKIKSYVMPLFFADLIYYCVELIFFAVDHNYAAINYDSLKNFFYCFFSQERYYSAWFLSALFFAVLFAYPMVKLTYKNKISGILLSLALLFFGLWFNKEVNKTLPWNMDAAFVGSFFVYCGYFFHHELPKAKAYIEENRFKALGVGFMLQALNVILLSVANHDYGTHLEMWARWYRPFYLIIPSALFGCIGITLISYAISNKVFSTIGKMTLFILISQQDIAMRAAKTYWFKDWYTSLSTLPVDSYQRSLYALTVTSIAILIGMALYYIVRYSPFCIFYNYPLKDFYLKPFKKKQAEEKAGADITPTEEKRAQEEKKQ